MSELICIICHKRVDPNEKDVLGLVPLAWPGGEASAHQICWDRVVTREKPVIPLVRGRVSPETIARVEQLLKEGKSQVESAEAVGVSQASVQKVAASIGWNISWRKVSERGNVYAVPRTIDSETESRIEALLRSGNSLIDCVTKIGVNITTIKTVAHKIGWDVRWRKTRGQVNFDEAAAAYREGQTLEKISNKYGVSRERVRQVLEAGGFDVTAEFAKRRLEKKAKRKEEKQKYLAERAEGAKVSERKQKVLALAEQWNKEWDENPTVPPMVLYATWAPQYEAAVGHKVIGLSAIARIVTELRPVQGWFKVRANTVGALKRQKLDAELSKSEWVEAWKAAVSRSAFITKYLASNPDSNDAAVRLGIERALKTGTFPEKELDDKTKVDESLLDEALALMKKENVSARVAAQLLGSKFAAVTVYRYAKKKGIKL
jgi:hypothetical protein